MSGAYIRSGGHTTPNPLDSLILAQKIIKDGARGVVLEGMQFKDQIR